MTLRGANSWNNYFLSSRGKPQGYHVGLDQGPINLSKPQSKFSLTKMPVVAITSDMRQASLFELQAKDTVEIIYNYLVLSAGIKQNKNTEESD